jgi:hypothetical protein
MRSPQGAASERAAATSSTKKCPYCAEEVKTEAVICKSCKSDLRPAIPQSHAPNARGASNQGDELIQFMQLKKSVGMAIFLNFLWAGAGIFYVKCPSGRWIVWVNIIAFLIGYVTFFLPSLILFIWSSVLCNDYVQAYNLQLQAAIREGRLQEFNRRNLAM